MPIYEVHRDRLTKVDATSFSAEGLYERRDIQRLLKEHIEILDDRLMVIAEEFGDWLDSARRIDLLCLDADANIVVIELKRSEDGGHMDLQALRYAAMVSAMTFAQAVETLAYMRNNAQPDLEAAKADILSFLSWDGVNEDQFGQDTRIILAAADFSKELTTAVMWLIEHDIDIRCIRLKPYKLKDGPMLLDIQQLIPLPEAASFQTQLGVKRQAERKQRAERHDLRYKFWEGLLEKAKKQTDLHANRSPSTSNYTSGGIGRYGFSLTYVVRQNDSQVELWISHGNGRQELNKVAFNSLLAQKQAIEEKFGGKLDWQELPDQDSCRICYLIEGGYKSPPDEWPRIHEELIGAMIRLDKAIRGPVMALNLKGG